ncbi:hypothetical protein AVEN_115061-1 [Araneus ventricosus]|uniref:Uncharacterized protein n=1 Tax=Araneus ventricosus TaxID=182803 RepID=A0A4Y1ZYW4_ARAVE|nr:hypothetical protein AVEN_115061-1 [Araneus ventricosus]
MFGFKWKNCSKYDPKKKRSSSSIAKMRSLMLKENPQSQRKSSRLSRSHPEPLMGHHEAAPPITIAQVSTWQERDSLNRRITKLLRLYNETFIDHLSKNENTPHINQSVQFADRESNMTA